MTSIKTSENSVAAKNPALAEQWHPTKNGDLTPENVTVGSKHKIWWLGDCGHEWEAIVSNRHRNNTSCPYCSGNKVLPGFNDMATTHPEIAATFAVDLNPDIDPLTLSIGSNKMIWWRCEQGHEWRTKPNMRKVTKTLCPACAGFALVTGVNDLATKRPALAAMWHPTKNGDLTPDKVSFGSHDNIWWQCPEGHEWQKTINRSQTDTCSVCEGTVLNVGVDDAATVAPYLLDLWNEETNGSPDQLSALSSISKRKFQWKCTQDHKWESTIKTLVKHDGECPHCAGRVFTVGVNDLATLHPEVVAVWDQEKNESSPSEHEPYSYDQVNWKCAQGHEWEQSIRGVVRNAGMCPECRRRASVNLGITDINPIAAAQWHPTKNGDLTPDVIAYASGRYMWWICDQGHEWKAKVQNRTVLNAGCPQCYASSFVSRGESEVAEMVRDLGFDVKVSDRATLRGRELDIYIPEKKFAVEFNGLFWHSERCKPKDYHRDKVELCQAAGITLYQVWEDDWREKKDIVMQGIAHRLGKSDLPRIGARSLKAGETTYATAAEFLDSNHIQGSVAGSFYFTLTDAENKIFAVLVVKKTSVEGDYSIERYATSANVPGGFTKLLKHAQLHISEVKKWITFADRAVSDGGLYEKHGFIADKVLDPDYSYIVRGRREHKFNYRKARFQSDPSLEYVEGATERELADMNSLIRVWDSGKVRYIKEV